MYLLFNDVRYSPDASSNVSYLSYFLLVADMKCGLYEINQNNRVNATHGLSLFQKMFPDQTETLLDQRGRGPGSVLTLLLINNCDQLH